MLGTIFYIYKYTYAVYIGTPFVAGWENMRIQLKLTFFVRK